jgi:hypothetical protein
MIEASFEFNDSFGVKIMNQLTMLIMITFQIKNIY